MWTQRVVENNSGIPDFVERKCMRVFKRDVT